MNGVTGVRHPRVWVCVPTYNEAENVANLCRDLLEVFLAKGINGHVLVIDDASPDGTGAIAGLMAVSEPRVSVLHRQGKAGIGPAYLDGFRYALENRADFIMEMDCDFSHDPATLPDLLGQTGNADLVLGSRYVAGGSIEDWSLPRRVLSRAGCAYARGCLGVDIRDLTGGFKCFSRTVLEALPLNSVSTSGYGFQVELTYRAIEAGFSVTEVPITYRERKHGTSKMSLSIALEAMLAVLRLRFGRRTPTTRPLAPSSLRIDRADTVRR